MGTPATNFTGMTISDIGDDNNDASGEVAGEPNSVANSLDVHDHTVGLGRKVPSAGIGIDAEVPFNSNGIGLLSYATFVPRAPAGVPNGSIFLSNVDGKLRFRSVAGADQIFVTVPGQV